ncbi:MAG: hypothetical protein JST93_06870 [Acidobacteria bacterium]|nr:hypothetical protein [Acidobacteriota bacterium]
MHESDTVIWETTYWKADLLRRASWLETRQSGRRWSKAASGKLEQEVMLGFYSIRKLVEAHKVPDALVAEGMPLRSYPAVGTRVTYFNFHRFPELYDFSRPSNTSRDLRAVCNQVVHSYVFAPLFDTEGQVEGVLFNSDRTRDTEILFAAIPDIAIVFRAVSNCDPSSLHAVFDDRRGDFEVKVGPSTEEP